MGRHIYSYKGLFKLKKEIQEVFFSYKKLLMKEHNMGGCWIIFFINKTKYPLFPNMNLREIFN